MAVLDRRVVLLLVFFVVVLCGTYKIHIATEGATLDSISDESAKTCKPCAGDVKSEPVRRVPSATATFAALEWSGKHEDECLSVRSDKIFYYMRKQGATSSPQSAEFVFMLTDTLMDVSYPGKTCHADGNYVKTTEMCMKCAINPWYEHATALLEHQMKNVLRNGDSSRKIALDTTWPACSKYFIVFASAYVHPIEIRKNFFQDNPCVVRLLQDAEHGVYRTGLDISFPTLPYPSVISLRDKFIDDSNAATLHHNRLHLLGFQGRGWRRKNLTPFLLKMQWYRDEIARALQKFRRPDIFVNVNMDPPPENYMKAMNSTFGLVLRGDKTYSFRLFEVIAAGAIPVIISVPYVLPFAEILPWHTFSVLWPAGKIHELPGHLDDIAQNPQRLRKMQENLQRAWLNHFQSPEKQVETVKQILQWRRDSAAHAGEGQWDGGFVV
eukprot:m.58330 g.58330  ORF g.58330 m.58330 type:complete len:439 (-) comp15643_c0_seq2:179-1495(-)